MRCVWLCVLCAGLLAAGLGFRAGLPDLDPALPTRPALDPTKAANVVMTEAWSLWRTQEMMGDRRRRDKRSIHTQYYRQRPGADHADLVYETFHHHQSRPVGVLSDGTVILSNDHQGELKLIDPRGHARQVRPKLPGHDADRLAVLGVYDEGLFVQPGPQAGQHGNKSPLYFVPFRDGTLDVAGAVTLTEGDGIVFRQRRPVVAAWPRVAWIDENGLYVFDLISREVSEIAFDGKPERGYDEVRGFDGRFIALRKLVIDTHSGQAVARFNDNRPITIRDGVMYELDVRRGGDRRARELILQARDLRQHPKQTIELTRVPSYDLYWGYGSRRQPSSNVGPSIVQPIDEGLRIFDNEAWITVPYLDRDAEAE
jgi:hypothetical protein